MTWYKLKIYYCLWSMFMKDVLWAFPPHHRESSRHFRSLLRIYNTDKFLLVNVSQRSFPSQTTMTKHKDALCFVVYWSYQSPDSWVQRWSGNFNFCKTLGLDYSMCSCTIMLVWVHISWRRRGAWLLVEGKHTYNVIQWARMRTLM